MQINTFSDWFLLCYFIFAVSYCIVNTIYAIKKHQNEFIDNFDRSAHRLFIRSALWPMFTVFTLVYGIYILITQIKDKRKNNNNDAQDKLEVETSAIINWSITSDEDRQNIKVLTTNTLNEIRRICIDFRNKVYHDANALGYNTSYQKYFITWLQSKLFLINNDVVNSIADTKPENELTRRNLYIDPDNWTTISTLSDINATYLALCQFADKAKADEANSVKPDN